MKSISQKLDLKRPLCFLDIESTGLNTEDDRIVELCVLKVYPDVVEPEIKTRRLNPTIPISAGASEVHGITDEDVRDCNTFKEIADSLHTYIEGCDLAGYHSLAFDFPMLRKEFERAGIDWDYTKVNLIDVGNIVKIQNPRDLTSAFRMYCQKELEGAHGAEADTLATAEIFVQQLKREETPQTLDELALYSNYDKPLLDLSGKFTLNQDGEKIFNFGPYRGEPIEKHLDFVEWMYGKDFAPDTKRICADVLNKHPFY